MRETQLWELLPEKYLPILHKLKPSFLQLQEIRFRAGKPLTVRMNQIDYFITREGIKKLNPNGVEVITSEDIEEVVLYLCQDSIYAYQEELKRGYMTGKGGNRIGIVGQTVKDENGIITIRNFSGVNIRISHEIIGAADVILRFIYKEGGIQNILIAAKPGCGKTTLLRDAIRQISDGNAFGKGCNVSVIDERSELGGCFQGTPQNDLGLRSDILDGCPKAYGIFMVIRSMTPDVIAVDEIGDDQDLKAIKKAVSCGCKLIATIHSESFSELKSKGFLGDKEEISIFDTILFLADKKNIGKVAEVWKRRDGEWRCEVC